jgi:predicted nucleic acid-binding protein
LIGSLLVAGAIVAVTIALVTAKFGPTSAAELEALEERQEQLLEQQEERREDQEERLEEREDRRD